MKIDKRKFNGGKGGRTKMFQEGTARITVAVPEPEKTEYKTEVEKFIQKKYKKQKKDEKD